MPLPMPRRSLTVTVLTTLVTAGLAGTGTTGGQAAAAGPASVAAATADVRPAAVVRSGGAVTLPRGTLRRGPAPVRRAASVSPTPSGTLTPGTRSPAALTASPVSTFQVTFVDTSGADGRSWTAPAKASFNAAIDLWSRTVDSAVPITVTATATSMPPGALGSAGPAQFVRNDNGTATDLADDVFEPIALFNARTGGDAAPGEPDIEADFDPTLTDLYLGTDGAVPAEQYDFRSIVLHEIGHGLGLVGTGEILGGPGSATVGLAGVNPGTDVRSPVSYDVFAYTTTPAEAGAGGTRVISLPDGSAELALALTGDQLYWAGQQARTVAAGAPVRLFAPSQCEALDILRPCGAGESPYLPGSSFGHLDEGTYAQGTIDSLMTPVLDPGESLADPGQLTMGLLADLGYAVPALAGSRFTALDPVRLLDTRAGTGAPAGPVGPGGVLDLQVTGVAGVPADATAVVLNVTGVLPSEATDVRVYPSPITPSPVPRVSNLNLAAGVTRANLVTAPIGADGRVRLRNQAGSVGLLADLAGFYTGPASSTFPAASTFTAVDPVRVLDTREALGTPGTTPVPAGGSVDVQVTGVAGVPAGATAVAMTVTAVGASGGTDIRAYPAGVTEAVPLVSNLNVADGRALPNVVIVKLGEDGAVRLLNRFGDVHLLADVAGYYDASAAGSLFRAVAPSRLLDTRIRLGVSPTAPMQVGPGEALSVAVAGVAGIPRLASAAVLNVTGIGASTFTDVRVFPATATDVPRVSNLNLAPGQTAPDLVVVRLGGGRVTLRNSAGAVALVADAAGWFGPA